MTAASGPNVWSVSAVAGTPLQETVAVVGSGVAVGAGPGGTVGTAVAVGVVVVGTAAAAGAGAGFGTVSAVGVGAGTATVEGFTGCVSGEDVGTSVWVTTTSWLPVATSGPSSERAP